MGGKRWIVIAALAASACGFTIAPLQDDGSVSPDAVDDAGTDASSDATPPGPWLTGWSKRKPITLQASRIDAPGDGALSNFPVLIAVDDPAVSSTGPANGSGLAFTADDGVTRLSHEIEGVGASGLVVWVRVPQLSSTVDTTLYLYYGNPTPPAASPAANVWTAEYQGVWHLAGDPGASSGTIPDAAGTRDGAASPSMAVGSSVAGQVGRALAFDGAADYIGFGQIDTGGTFTISMWIRLEDDDNIKTLMANSASGAGVTGYRFFINTHNTNDRRILFETGNGTNNVVARTNMGAVVVNAWTHIAVVVDRPARTASIVVNGVDVTANTPVADFLTNSDFDLGRMENGYHYFHGRLDQVELSSTRRSIEWLRTAYNNQFAPATFAVFGPEQSAP